MFSRLDKSEIITHSLVTCDQKLESENYELVQQIGEYFLYKERVPVILSVEDEQQK